MSRTEPPRAASSLVAFDDFLSKFRESNITRTLASAYEASRSASGVTSRESSSTKTISDDRRVFAGCADLRPHRIEPAFENARLVVGEYLHGDVDAIGYAHRGRRASILVPWPRPATLARETDGRKRRVDELIAAHLGPAKQAAQGAGARLKLASGARTT
jgi:hypothetical protein